MALTAVGFAKDADGNNGSVSAQAWARMQELSPQAYRGQLAASGFNLTTNAAALTVGVSAGEMLMPGLLVTMDAPQQVTLPAPSSVRTDLIALKADWAANAQKGLVSLVRLAALSDLVQQAGVVWHTLLGRVVVRNSGVVAGSDLFSAKPLPWAARPFQGSPVAARGFSRTASDAVVSTVEISDPGWPYYLDYTAAMRFVGDSGDAVLRVRIDGGNAGQTTSVPRMAEGSPSSAQVRRVTGLRTGRCTVEMTVTAANVVTNQEFSTPDTPANYLEVLQVPAYS